MTYFVSSGISQLINAILTVTENCIIHIWQHHLNVDCQLTSSVLSADNRVKCLVQIFMSGIM